MFGNEAIIFMRDSTLPITTPREVFSDRWASEVDGEELIYDEFIKELDALLNRFASEQGKEL